MSTTAGSRSPRVVTMSSSPGATDIASDHHRGGWRQRCSSRTACALGHLGRAAARGRVVERDRQVGGSGRPQPPLDHLPRLQPIGQRQHHVVAAEWCPCAGRDGLGRGDPGQHGHPHARVRRVGRDGLERGGRHPEDPRVTTGDQGDLLAPQRQVQGQPGPVQFDGVAAGVALQTWTRRHPVHVRSVADDVLDQGECVGHLGGDPAVRTGTETDDQQLGRGLVGPELPGPTAGNGRGRRCRPVDRGRGRRWRRSRAPRRDRPRQPVGRPPDPCWPAPRRRRRRVDRTAAAPLGPRRRCAPAS